MAAGVTYVLVANELIVPQPLERVAALARDAAVSVAVDSRSGAETLSAAAASPGVTLGGGSGRRRWDSDGAACRAPPQRSSCLVPSWPSGTFAWTG